MRRPGISYAELLGLRWPPWLRRRRPLSVHAPQGLALGPLIAKHNRTIPPICRYDALRCTGSFKRRTTGASLYDSIFCGLLDVGRTVRPSLPHVDGCMVRSCRLDTACDLTSPRVIEDQRAPLQAMTRTASSLKPSLPFDARPL